MEPPGHHMVCLVVVTVPDNKSRNIPEVVLEGRVGVGRRVGQMGSVYKQPETEVDDSCHSWRVPSK